MSTNGPTGLYARSFATGLQGKTITEILQILDGHAASGECTRAVGTSGGKPMIRYHFPDATFVRVKPEGTSLTPEPIYMIEVVKRNHLPLTIEDIAFKVDARERPIPRGPQDVRLPSRYGKHDNPIQYTAYRDTVLGYGYQTAKLPN